MTVTKNFINVCLAVFVFTGGVQTLAAQTPNVAHNETRAYEVSIDDKPAGDYTLKLAESQDGTTTVESNATVTTKIFFFTYKYWYKGHEVWKSDRLISFNSDSTDNGKKCKVEASNADGGLHFKVNGKDHVAGADTITSSYWHLPPGDDLTFNFLEVDTGRLFKEHMQRVGEERLQVNNQQTELCQHYKGTGGDPCELWYDASRRLVKETSVDQGHKTITQLKSRTRE